MTPTTEGSGAQYSEETDRKLLEAIAESLITVLGVLSLLHDNQGSLAIGINVLLDSQEK